MTSLRSRFSLVVLFSLVIGANVLSAGSAAAQDVITVGTVTADNGPSVEVPVSLRDASGTPLGMDQPAASRIQAFSIRVTYSPASAVSAVTFSRAGVTANLQPIFETSPTSSGAISLLASFQQSTNPIPLTLNASAPGNQIARLVFTLSPSAAPGSVITLTLDSATTQLTDEGGSAATKETAGNGQLTLVNGSIQIPVPTATLTPSSQTVEAGDTTSLTINTGVRVIANTAVALSSSNTAVATVPASVNVPAGSRTASITVTGVAPGTATITATLPAGSGGASDTTEITVTEAPNCPKPASPVVNGPAAVLAGAAYDITWAAVANANDYVIEEATNPSFTGASSRTVTTTSASYSHPTDGVRYYYRVRARNRTAPCDETSSFSSSISVLITTVVPPAVRVIPVVGSTPGNAGSYFKTGLQLYNPKPVAISGKIVFHTQGASGSDADPSLAYSIPAGRTLSFADLLPAMGVATGLGSADLIGDTGSALPVTVARIFNDAGVAGTSGLALEAMPVADALQQGETGALLAPADLQRFRFNVGVRSLEQGATLAVTLRDRDGAVLKTVGKSYPATFFIQVGSAAFLDNFALTGGETLSIEVTGGSAFIYGSTTDNVTNDPSVQFARRIE